jgi:hypothetical protein
MAMGIWPLLPLPSPPRPEEPEERLGSASVVALLAQRGFTPLQRQVAGVPPGSRSRQQRVSR